MSDTIIITEYTAAHRQRFKEINEQWITRSFVEEEDIKSWPPLKIYSLKGGAAIF